MVFARGGPAKAARGRGTPCSTPRLFAWSSPANHQHQRPPAMLATTREAKWMQRASCKASSSSVSNCNARACANSRSTTWRTCASSSSAEPFASDPKKANLLQAFWKFTRPHTIRGTILGSVALTSRVLFEHSDAIR